MAEPKQSADGGSAGTGKPEGLGRRLSDKILNALQQATEQGRREIAERLKLVCEAIEDEDTDFPLDRREVD